MPEKSAKSQKQTKKGEFDIKEIYTSLSVAKKEIWKRWNNKELKKKVEDFLGGDVPYVLEKEPRAVLVRYIASPDVEYSHFLELAKMTGLKTICLEYLNDKFVAENEDKYHLGKMFFYAGVDKKWGYKTKFIQLIDFDEYDGCKFGEIITKDGDNFIDVHHRLMRKVIPSARYYDMSKWIENHGKTPEKFYRYFFSFFITHGILFENYINKGKELRFFKSNIMPALNYVENYFKIKPLIVPLIPEEEIDDLIWWCYPPNIMKLFKKR